MRKTIVFVTHDIDEAVKLGDRIAIFGDDHRLQQHATPAELLANPASQFVVAFVGADRGLKLLAVTPITPDQLRPPQPEDLDADSARAFRLRRPSATPWRRWCCGTPIASTVVDADRRRDRRADDRGARGDRIVGRGFGRPIYGVSCVGSPARIHA